MAKADVVYADLLKDIKENGIRKGDRTGTGTVSVFGRQIRFDMADGFPLLTTKKMFTRGIIEELIWFNNGGTNIKDLVEKDVQIWTGDAYKKYCNEFVGHEDIPDMDWFINEIKTNPTFSNKFGDLGPIYGKQWTDWGGFEIISGKEIKGYNDGVNQIQNALDLLISDPNSRRNMVNAWNVDEIDKMTLPPCHYGFQLNTEELTLEERIKFDDKRRMAAAKRKTGQTFISPRIWTSTGPTDHKKLDGVRIPRHKLSLMWNQRSVDTFLGLPFNIASYAFLLHMFAEQADMIPHELIGNLGDTHIYNNHLEQVDEQLSRATDMEAPRLFLNGPDDMFTYKVEDFNLKGYYSYPPIKGDLSN